MLALFHAPRTRSSRIIWLLEELGADCAICYVTIRYADGRGGEPDATNRHPDKKVPALDHDGTIVSESTAVALYLCELYPQAGLAPPAGDPARGDFLTWMCWTETEFGPAILAKMMGGGDARAQANFEAVARRLTEAMARGPYLLGDRFTAADVMVAAAIGWARPHLPASEAINAYLARVMSRPARLRAEAREEPTTPAAA